jgi:uncharacterized protein YacL
MKLHLATWILQITFIIFTLAFAFFQAPAVMAMRDYVPVNNPFATKYHFRGNLVAIFVAFILTLVSIYIKPFPWYSQLPVPFMLCAWYGLLFDSLLNFFTGKSFFYLGWTAKFDRWLNKKFPHGDAGEVKFIFCIGSLILLNLLKYFLP